MTRATLFAVASIVTLACAPTPASPTVASTPDASTTSASPDAESVQSAPSASDAAASVEEVADAEAAPEFAPTPAAAPLVAADAGEKTAGIIAPQRTGMGGGSRPASLEDALGSTPSGSHRTSAAAPSGDGPIDRAALLKALKGVKLDACKTKGGPTGAGRISLTFAPNGHVTKTEIEDPPYAETETAKCIEAKFRAARVPKFSGSAVSVKFPFKIGD